MQISSCVEGTTLPPGTIRCPEERTGCFMSRRAEVPACPVPLSPAFRLVAQCTIRPPEPQWPLWRDGIVALATQVTDWDEVLRLVRRHQVPVLVDDALKKSVAADAFPDNVRKALTQAAKRSRMNAMLQIAHSRRIATGFMQAGIPVIQLKGAPLSRRLYGDATLRCCGDVDLLIDFDSLGEAVAILEVMQFVLMQPIPESNSLFGLVTRHAYHDCSLVHASTQLHLELHWRPGAWGRRTSALLFRQSRNDAEFGPAAPPEILEMLDLLAHGTTHYWVLIKWLSDIQQAALICPASFWDDVMVRAREMGALCAVRIGAILACWIFQDRAGPLVRIAADASFRDFQGARYALGRMLAHRIHPRDPASIAAKVFYRLATCTSYQLISTACRCVPLLNRREQYSSKTVAGNLDARRS